MSKNKISFGQFTALLLISDAFAIICMRGRIGTPMALGILTAAAIQSVAAIPAVALCRKNFKISSSGTLWLKSILLAFSVMWGGALLINVWNTAKAIYIPSVFDNRIGDKLLISLLIAAVCLYVTSCGLKAIARAAVIAAGFGVICLIVVVVGAIGRIEPHYLEFTGSDSGYLDGIIGGFALGGSFGAYLMLLEKSADSVIKTTVFYFTGRIFFVALISFITISVVGAIMSITQFPFITAAELSQPLSSQRLDSIFAVVFVIFAILSISLQGIAISYLLKAIFPKFDKFRSLTSVAAMLCAAVILNVLAVGTKFYGTATALTAIAPAILLVARRRKNVCVK